MVLLWFLEEFCFFIVMHGASEKLSVLVWVSQESRAGWIEEQTACDSLRGVQWSAPPWRWSHALDLLLKPLWDAGGQSYLNSWFVTMGFRTEVLFLMEFYQRSGEVKRAWLTSVCRLMLSLASSFPKKTWKVTHTYRPKATWLGASCAASLLLDQWFLNPNLRLLLNSWGKKG